MEQTLLARIEELEARVAFQEHALSQLNDALSESRLEAQRHSDLLRRVLEELRNVRGSLYADPAQEPPPPHY
ncbi:MAG: SlyX family protein [Pseudoxanthomonas suwonensis]|nr:SlyX family protein [Pseudoxanthomonas suwonensis]